MNFNEIEQLEEAFQVATYAKMDIAVETGKGCCGGNERRRKIS